MAMIFLPYIFFAVFLMAFAYKQYRDRQKILTVLKQIKEGNISAKVDAKNLFFDNRALADTVNSIGSIIEEAVDKSTKAERLKASLITNVSHDIKTPLTSIINYVGLIKREKSVSPKTEAYLRILEEKSFKLKSLTEDLVEASKLSSGSVVAKMCLIDLVEMINQCIGENYDAFEEKRLIPHFFHEKAKVMTYADPELLWRVIDNLFGNIFKYALNGTIVSIEIKEKDEKIIFSLKNVSAVGINIDAEDLSERFVRGDESRSTSGYGLGLSIAKSLTRLQNAAFEVRLHGDLFQTIITFNQTVH